jgi:hypothetical protein
VQSRHRRGDRPALHRTPVRIHCGSLTCSSGGQSRRGSSRT